MEQLTIPLQIKPELNIFKIDLNNYSSVKSQLEECFETIGYKLEDSSLKGRVRIIICDDGYDASTIYEKYGINGIKKLMKSKRQLNDFDRIFDI